MNGIIGSVKQHYWAYRYTYGRFLSRIGERIGVEALVYNPVIMDLFGHIAEQVAPPLARKVCEQFPHAKSVVDLGCGTGHFVHAFHRGGLSAYGFERSEHARQYARAQFGLELSDFDLRTDCAGVPRADLSMSLEVVEHLPEPLGRKMVQLLTKSAPAVVFSGAHPGQGGQGHINEQPVEYWVREFEACGFVLDSGKTAALQAHLAAEAPLAPWLAVNVMVFRDPQLAA